MLAQIKGLRRDATAWLALLLVGAFVLAACGTGDLPAPAEGPISSPSLADATIEPAAVSSLQQYTSPDFGYSLSYPAGYEVQSSPPNLLVFLAPQGTQGHRQRALLTAEFTSDESAEWYASQLREANANLGTEITSSVQVIDGQQAYALGRLSGQDFNRQVFVVHDGILFHLTFLPDDPAAGEAYQQMEALYATVIGSLQFIPERRAQPPITDITNMVHELERAVNARSAEPIAGLMGDEFVIGDLDPTTAEGVTSSRHASADAIPLILNEHLSQEPSVTLQFQVDWASVPGSLDTYSGILPGEDVTPILARSWGPNGADEAVIIIARRSDGTLFWRGALVLQGALTP